MIKLFHYNRAGLHISMPDKNPNKHTNVRLFTDYLGERAVLELNTICASYLHLSEVLVKSV